jgi:hypothetical protein
VGTAEPHRPHDIGTDAPGHVISIGATSVPGSLDRYARQAYRLLHIAFITAPIAAGIDKFLNLMVNWEQYLAPVIASNLPIEPSMFMMIVGVIEIAAGLLVAVRPDIGGYVVAFWLWGIILNLLLGPGYYDIALRDLGLSLGALALARLATMMRRAYPR